MNIAGFTELVYGQDYLEWALRSVMPYVDEYHIAYSEEPLNRYNPYIKPDNRLYMHEVAQEVAFQHKVPMNWYERDWIVGQDRYVQRNSVFERTDADVVILVDADEIWLPGAIQQVIDIAKNGTTRFYRVVPRFFWRSFWWSIDPAECVKLGWLPIRAYNTKYDGSPSDKDACTLITEFESIYEFGFARSPRDFAYKMPSHGHYNKPKGKRWFNEVWLPWQPHGGRMKNVHPYGDGRFPEIEHFDALKLMPGFMHDHPYFHESVIGGDKVVGLERKTETASACVGCRQCKASCATDVDPYAD